MAGNSADMMTRAEKRRQRKLAVKAAKAAKPGPSASFSTEQALELALQHHTAGRLADAENIYRQILQADPDHPGALHFVGVIAHQQGRAEDAVGLIERAIGLNPEDVNAVNNLGQAYESLGRIDDAFAAYGKVLEGDPGHDGALNNLGNLLAGKGQFSNAIQYYQRALKADNNNPETLSNLGGAFHQQGLLDDALASYREALSIDPNFTDVHISLGNALGEQDQFEDAVLSYREALRLHPDHYGAHTNLGNALQKQGLLEDAVSSYREALRINPDYFGAHTNLGNALQEQGRLDEAMASHQQALAINPNSAEAWNNIKIAAKALVFSNPGEGRTLEAIIKGLDEAARATTGFAIFNFYMDGFRPHQADESFKKIFTALPAKADEAIPIDAAGGDGTPQLPDKMVALLHFGRSGTGLLHSLIDGHPEISTLPSVYLRGYFNDGVWRKISAAGWRQLPDRFADEFAVLFDARSPKPIPSQAGENPYAVGKNEGMTAVGENRDETLSLDRDAFRAEALRLMQGLGSVDPMSFLLIVHAAFETVMKPDTKKRLCFYHIHNPDDFAKPNFLRYDPEARLMMMVREPVQNCESCIRKNFHNNDYDNMANRIIGMLYDIDQVGFRMRNSVGVRLEDLKAHPEATMGALSAWLGVKDSPSLYEMTAQGKKWWGDPSSPDYDSTEAMSPFGEATTPRAVGTIFSENDQFVLRTLFYPFSVRFGYTEPDPGQFKKDLIDVRPRIDDMLDFEKVMADRSKLDHGQFKRNGVYLLFHAALLERWQVLDELGDYPHMLAPLEITID